jgi:hypothetical protein
MPSPFPGMDPYMEDAALWPTVHQSVITYAYEVLNSRLPEGFVASIGERVYVVQHERPVYPDVGLFRSPGASQALLEAPAPVTDSADIREPFIEVLDLRGGERVVTAIEVLSHANKASGSSTRRQYLTKQEELLNSSTHLLEIDLLRAGAPTVMPAPERLSERKPWHYVTCLHRAGRGRTFEVWLSSIQERLPRVRVPLTERHADVRIDLQSPVDRVYEVGAFARRVDYRRDPTPPLGPAEAEWADALLREKRLRG